MEGIVSIMLPGKSMWRRRRIPLVPLLALLAIVGCSRTPAYLEKYEEDPGNRVQLKAYFPTKLLNLSEVFLQGSENDFDVMVLYDTKDYEEREVYLKTSGKKGNYITRASFDISYAISVHIYDVSNNLLVAFTERQRATGETGGFPGIGTDRSTSQSRARESALRDAYGQIFASLDPTLVRQVTSNPNIRQYEEHVASLREQGIENRSFGTGKLPFRCLFVLPANIDDIKATTVFMRSIIIHSERQAGTTSIDIGTMLKESMFAELQDLFADAKCMNSSSTEDAIGYNPHELLCIVELHYNDTEVAYKTDHTVKLDASALIKTGTGATYKEIDLATTAAISLGEGAASHYAYGLLTGFSMTRYLAEGALIKQALKNACKSVAGDVAQKLRLQFDGDFLMQFPEFSAYDAAVKGQSLNDIRFFFSMYPQSPYSSELRALYDKRMYDFAVSADSVEPYLEYLDLLPNGTHRSEVLTRLKRIVVDEIRAGNLEYCDLYMNVIAAGDKLDEIQKQCEVP
jgi:hypothetical protein